jgi:hypothetical protein
MAVRKTTTANNPKNLVLSTKYLLFDNTIPGRNSIIEDEERVNDPYYHLAAWVGNGGAGQYGGARHGCVCSGA